MIPFEAIVDSPGGTTSVDYIKLAQTPEGEKIIKRLQDQLGGREYVVTFERLGAG